jgi:hypothetical protein
MVSRAIWSFARQLVSVSVWKTYAFGSARHVTSLKTAWKNTRKNAKVSGRWHDNRHTLITELAESGAGDETIMEIMLIGKCYGTTATFRMKAKRAALEAALAGRSQSSR